MRLWHGMMSSKLNLIVTEWTDQHKLYTRFKSLCFLVESVHSDVLSVTGVLISVCTNCHVEEHYMRPITSTTVQTAWRTHPLWTDRGWTMDTPLIRYASQTLSLSRDQWQLGDAKHIVSTKEQMQSNRPHIIKQEQDFTHIQNNIRHSCF